MNFSPQNPIQILNISQMKSQYILQFVNSIPLSPDAKGLYIRLTTY